LYNSYQINYATIKKRRHPARSFDLYDQYAHNKLERRDFLAKLSLYAVGTVTVGSLLSFISPNYPIIW
jgi:carboxymethylenebutenolidase